MLSSRQLVALLAGSLAFACSPPDAERMPAQASRGSADDPGIGLYGDFGFRLYEASRADSSSPRAGSNVFLSPTSAGLALALAAEGARGQTRVVLQQALGVADTASEAFTQRNRVLLEALRNLKGLELTIANALWADEAVEFERTWAERLPRAYMATVDVVDLQSPEFVARSSAWVTRATRGRIRQIVEAPLADDAVLTLTNAVYFKGKWLQEFDPALTRREPFTRATGASTPQPLMHQEGRFAYYADSMYRMARLPYQGDRMALYVVLPADGQPAVLDRSPPPGWFAAALGRLQRTELDLALPRFTLEYERDLTSPLVRLGAGPALQPGADFSGAVSPAALGGRQAYIRRVLQRTFVEVNEEGTEAAAATAVEVAADSAASEVPVPFIVNRPFWLALRDDATGELLFIGHVGDPAAGS